MSFEVAGARERTAGACERVAVVKSVKAGGCEKTTWACEKSAVKKSVKEVTCERTAWARFVNEVACEKREVWKEKKAVRRESLTAFYGNYLMVLNSIPLICLYCGLVAPNADL